MYALILVDKQRFHSVNHNIEKLLDIADEVAPDEEIHIVAVEAMYSVIIKYGTEFMQQVIKSITDELPNPNYNIIQLANLVSDLINKFVTINNNADIKDVYEVLKPILAKPPAKLPPKFKQPQVIPESESAPQPQSGGTNSETMQRASRSSDTKDTIHNFAEGFWKDNGAPTDIKEVLKLRRQMMQVLLDEFCIKKTTSSNELGKWQKTHPEIK